MMGLRFMPFNVIKCDKLNLLPMNSLLCTLFANTNPFIYTHTPIHVLKSSRHCTIDISTRVKHIELEQHSNSTLVRAHYAFDLI